MKIPEDGYWIFRTPNDTIVAEQLFKGEENAHLVKHVIDGPFKDQELTESKKAISGYKLAHEKLSHMFADFAGGEGNPGVHVIGTKASDEKSSKDELPGKEPDKLAEVGLGQAPTASQPERGFLRPHPLNGTTFRTLPGKGGASALDKSDGGKPASGR